MVRRTIMSFCVLFVVMALPQPLRSPTGSRELLAAVKAITTIHTAETQYYSEHGGYAASLAQLGPNGADLIDNDLASGEKGGFKFVAQQTRSG
jgi:hypothetical protein